MAFNPSKGLLFLIPAFMPFLMHAQTPLTALTYNIRYDNPGDGEDTWSKRRDFLAAQIAFVAPDIFGIQEGLHHQVTYLSTQLPDYDRVGGGRDDGKEAGEYSALYFRRARFGLLESGTFWLSTTPDTVSKGWDAALPRVCTYAHLYDSLSNKKIWAFNTHFDHIGKKARAESAKLILDQIALKNVAGEPVVLTGDFNAEPTEEPVTIISNAMQESYGQSRIAPFGPQGTFNAFKFHEPVLRRIDYIFVDKKNWTVLQNAVLSDSRNCHYPSDHLPVMARMLLHE